MQTWASTVFGLWAVFAGSAGLMIYTAFSWGA
uniref:Uncharacterized protein n=1 Tax=Rhizophora mucronata TaxID=61149 RepID=A0A2P2JT29_RHIMU